jgi:hypothetical protein
MAEQIQSLSSLLPESAPFRETFRQADVLIADLEASGYKKQADDYRNSIISQVQLGKMAKNPQEVKAIADNIQNIFGGLKSLSKTSLEKQQQDEPYTYITPEQEIQQYGGPLEGTYVRKGTGGKPERIEPGRTYASPEEQLRLEQLKAADQTLGDVKKEAESFLKITPELNQLNNLLDSGVQTGKFQNAILPLKQFATDLGISVGDVASQEQFRAISGQLALTFGQKLKGSMSDGDRALLVDKISPSVGLTPEGNKMIIEFYKAGAEKNKMIRDTVLRGRKEGKNPYEIEEDVNNIIDSDIIVEKVTKKFPQLMEQGQQATQPPTINYTPDAQNALERARALQQKK